MTPGNVHRELPETETGMQGRERPKEEQEWWEIGLAGRKVVRTEGEKRHERKAGFKLMREDRTEG